MATALADDSPQTIPDQLASDVNKLIQSTTSANLPDVLRVITGLSNSVADSRLLSLALEHDRDHVHLLHPTADQDTDQQDTSTAVAGARKPDTTLQQQRRRQQPQQFPAAVLLKELLGIAITLGFIEAVDVLCKLPSASSLGVSQVLQLMLAAASCQALEEDQIRVPCIMASLCGLPAAQAVQAGSIAALLRRGIKTRAWHRLLPLLRLPNAKQISAQCWSVLIKGAAALGAFDLVGALCRMVRGQRLDRRPVVELVKLFLDAYDRRDVFLTALPQEWTDIYEGWLSDLKPGEYLTGDDVLELLEFVTEKGMYSYSTVCWQPAVSQITITPRLIRLLQAMACSQPSTEPRHHGYLPNALPAVRQLGPADWYQVLIVALNEGRTMFEGCTDLPGMQQLDAEQVSGLLRACVGKQSLEDDVVMLLTLPGAKLMSADVIGNLLQQFLQAMPADAAISHDLQPKPAWIALLCLPRIAQMPFDVVQQLYNTAFETGSIYVAKALLLKVPQQAEAVHAVTAEQLLRGVLAAIKRVPKGGDLLFWREERGLQSLDAGSCAQLVQALLHLAERIDADRPSNSSSVIRDEWHANVSAQLLNLVYTVLQVPACQQLQAPDAVQIHKACLRLACSIDRISEFERAASEACQRGLSHVVQSYTGYDCHAYCAFMVVLAVTEMPAAADINHAQLLELLSEACRSFPVACLWKQLMQLPAAHQLMPAELAAVLSKVVDGSCAEDTSRLACYDVSVVGVLLQHPVGQQLSVGEISALLDRIAQQVPRCGLLAVAGQLLQHPVAASMTCDTASQLLGLFAGVEGASSAVMGLLQLPAAQQLSWNQIKPLLWQCACQSYQTACEVLCSLPAAAAAARDDPEVQVLMADNSTYWVDEPVDDDDGHVEREWCTCPKCSQLQGL